MCEEKGLIKVFWLWQENEFCTCKKWILSKNFIACNGDINGVTCNDNYYLLQLQFEPRLQYRVRNKNKKMSQVQIIKFAIRFFYQVKNKQRFCLVILHLWHIYWK